MHYIIYYYPLIKGDKKAHPTSNHKNSGHNHSFFWSPFIDNKYDDNILMLFLFNESVSLLTIHGNKLTVKKTPADSVDTDTVNE